MYNWIHGGDNIFYFTEKNPHLFPLQYNIYGSDHSSHHLPYLTSSSKKSGAPWETWESDPLEPPEVQVQSPVPQWGQSIKSVQTAGWIDGDQSCGGHWDIGRQKIRYETASCACSS